MANVPAKKSVKISANMIQAAQTAQFNASKWTPTGEEASLEDLWAVTNPGLYEQIEGDEAEVTATQFEDGNIGLRITVPFKGGDTMDLKLSGKSDLEEGDVVKISSIKAVMLKKAGQKDIMRFDAEAV